MKLREIKQHNRFSIIIITVLLFCDLISYYLAHFFVSLIKDKNIIIESPYLVIFGIMFIFHYFNMYNPSSLKSRSKEIKTIFNIVFTITFLYLCSKILLVKNSILHFQDIILLSIFFVIIVILLRLTVRTIQKQLLHWDIGLKKAVIIGSNSNTNLFKKSPKIGHFGYDIIGYFSNSESNNFSKNYKYLGKLNQVESFLNGNNINEIIITLEKEEDNTLIEIISNLKNMDVCVKIIPDIYDILKGYAKMHNVTGVPLIDINLNILTELQSLMKRICDIFIALFGLIITSPLLIVVSVLIKISSKGNIIFSQDRVGLNGKPFIVHKFRTMYDDSEKDTGPVWAKVNDPRITKIGYFLRKTRIDEFPQLFDVLIGNMSIVGPRPERQFFISQLKEKFPYYMRRLNVRPGITGWAQIMGSYDTDIDNVENKLKLDFYYIENISIWLDIKIMIITIWVILSGKGQ